MCLTPSWPEISTFDALLCGPFLGPITLLSRIQARVLRQHGSIALQGSASQALPVFQHVMGKHTSGDVLKQQARYAQKTCGMWGKMQHVKAFVSGVKSTSDGQVHEITPSTAISDCHGSTNGTYAANVRSSLLNHVEMCVGP